MQAFRHYAETRSCYRVQELKEKLHQLMERPLLRVHNPKTVASLEAIVQEKSEPLRDYIERFNKEVVQVQGADETMKRYLIAKGLREGTDVKKAVRLDRPRTLNEFLVIAKIYIA
jgi:hypothetical protein